MSPNPGPSLIPWLLEQGGPVVQWRTAAELCRDFPPVELECLKQDLLAAPLVRETLSRLDLGDLAASLDEPRFQRLGRMVHGGPRTCLENVFGQLAECGLGREAGDEAEDHGELSPASDP